MKKRLYQYAKNKLKGDTDLFDFKSKVDSSLEYFEAKEELKDYIIHLLEFEDKINLLKDNHIHKSRVMTKAEVWRHIRACW